MGSHRLGLLYASVSCCALLMTGCNPEKAKSLQVVAVQFQSESLAAIDAIAHMHEQELASVKRPDEQVRQEFIQNILGYDNNLDPQVVELAIAPYEVNKSPEVKAQWQAFLDQLRSQYNTFGSIYDSVQTGVMPSGEAVAQSTAIAQKLTAQLSAFASILDENPPMLIQQRSATLTALEDQRQQYQRLRTERSEQETQLTEVETQLTTVQTKLKALPAPVTATTPEGTPIPDPNLATRQQLTRQQTALQTQKQAIETKLADITQQQQAIEVSTGKLMDEWQAIRATEAQLLEDTVRQCLKAASLGEELIKLSQTYNQLSLPTLNGAIANILQQSNALGSLNFAELDNKADTLFNNIKTASNWQTVANDSLSQVTNLLQKQVPSPAGLNLNMDSLTDPNAGLFQLPQ